MTLEESIQWALQHGAINEKELRHQMPSIEHYCEENSITIERFLYVLVDMVNFGLSVKTSVKEIMERASW